MRLKKMIVSSLVLMAVLSAGTPAKAQLMRDTTSFRLVRQDIDLIYNMQFDEARQLSVRIEALHPGHPVNYLLKGMITYWENFPLTSTSTARSSFEADLKECIRLAEEKTSHEDEAEYLLANLCARGFLLLFYSDNDLVMDVIPLTTGTYKYMMRAFDFTGRCTDLYYFTGLYNYYRDAYPKAYPVYKPLALLFPPGDLQKGLYQLNASAVGALALRGESMFLLIYIYLNFENNYYKAYSYSEQLYRDYPRNPEVRADIVKTLLLLKRYDEAEKLSAGFRSGNESSYLNAILNILDGIISEKKYRDRTKAELLYNKGIKGLSLYGSYGNEYSAYGYFGLSRISGSRGEDHASHMYRKEALKLADFKKVDFD